MLSFGRSQAENYTLREEHLACSSSCKDLGVTVCTDLSWSEHRKNIIGKAYQILGLIMRTLGGGGGSCNVETRKTLYLTLVRSKLTYCSQVWRPQYIKDTVKLEQVQQRATRFILGGDTLSYKNRLLKLHILPLMMWFEMADIMLSFDT